MSLVRTTTFKGILNNNKGNCILKITEKNGGTLFIYRFFKIKHYQYIQALKIWGLVKYTAVIKNKSYKREIIFKT